MRRAHQAGLTVVAITDHDTLAGVAEATRAGADLGVRVVAGCEFSAQCEWGEVHLLGYFLPPEVAELEDFLLRWRTARRHRARRMVAALERQGIPVALEDVLDEAAGGSVGRPHLARVLVRTGVVAREQEAFDRWLAAGRPAYVAKELPTVAEVAAVVRAAGGLLVAAHLRERGTDASVRTFQADGVQGVEVRHPSHAPAIERRLSKLATRYDLARTGGSDWHGDGRARETGAPLGSHSIPNDWLTDLEDRHARSAPTR